MNNRDSTGHYLSHLCVTATQNSSRVPHDVYRSIPYSSAQRLQVDCITI
jgi:hypothetical protein